MKPYLAVLSARFRMLLQYRVAALAGCSTQLFWGLIRVMIFEGFYLSSTAPQPMSFPQVVTYIWLGQSMLLLMMFGPDADVRAMIQTGTIAYELVRPVRLYWLWYSRAIAARCAPLILRAAPILIVAGAFLGMQAPASRGCAALWLLSTAAAILLTSSVATLMTISLLWTISGEGINQIIPALIWTSSGLLIPLPLLPKWVQPAVKVLPFRGMGDTPFRFYMGHIPPEQALLAVAHQLAWTAALILLGQWILNRGLRRLVVQGG